MASIKMTSANFDTILEDMSTGKGTARTDIYYFSQGEFNESDIKQMAWKKNIIIAIQNVDTFVSKLTFIDNLLN